METKYHFDENGGSLKCQNSITSPMDDSDNGDSGGFQCNICLDNVQDPVITLCGHLYCWPCIYTWINHPSGYPECPVCKAELSEKSLIPLYGRDQGTNTSQAKPTNLGMVVPQRPRAPQFQRPMSSCHEVTFSPMLGHNRSHMRQLRIPVRSTPLAQHAQQHRDYPQPQFVNVDRPGFRMLGQRVYLMMFGDSSYYNSTNSTSRFRRQMKEVDISLSRLCFFMFCCMVFCLLSF